MAKDFFDLLTKENDVSIFAGGINSPLDLPNLENIQISWSKNPNAFLKEYYNTISTLDETTDIKSALILLKLIYVNVEFSVDSKSLSDLLIILSNQIQKLDTIYKNYQCDGVWGFLIAYKLTMKIDDILTYRSDKKERPLSYEYIINALSQIPITNTILAGWKHSVFKKCGLRVERKVTRAVKALYLYDHLVGCGVKDILINNTKEKAEKKLKPLYDAELQNVADRILEFYLCKTGNEKKRFLTDIEKFVNETPITELVNNFLIN